MNGNLPYQEEPREEMLNGKIYMMSSPSVAYSRQTFHSQKKNVLIAKKR